MFIVTLVRTITLKLLLKFSSVQSLSHVRLFVTPWIAARQASLSITNSWRSLRLTSIESVMPSSHLILCRPLLLWPPIQHKGLFQWVNSSHEVAKVLEFQLQHQGLTNARCSFKKGSVCAFSWEESDFSETGHSKGLTWPPFRHRNQELLVLGFLLPGNTPTLEILLGLQDKPESRNKKQLLPQAPDKALTPGNSPWGC